jgi:hypothetical protein
LERESPFRSESAAKTGWPPGTPFVLHRLVRRLEKEAAMETPRPMPDPAPDPEEKPRSLDLRRFLERLPRTGSEIPWRPVRRVLLLVLLILGAVALWRAAQSGFQSIGPGFVGVSANRFTGSLEELPPGTHFRPPALYQIHPVRVSDQLLADDALTVTTKEGVIARSRSRRDGRSTGRGSWPNGRLSPASPRASSSPPCSSRHSVTPLPATRS